MNTAEFVKAHGLEAIPYGSRATCNPPPMDTDADYLVWVPEEKQRGVLRSLANDMEWIIGTVGCSEQSQRISEGWVSARNSEENMVLVWNRPLFEVKLVSTVIAKRLNLMRKEDRVALFTELEAYWPGLQPKPTGELGDIFA